MFCLHICMYPQRSDENVISLVELQKVERHHVDSAEWSPFPCQNNKCSKALSCLFSLALYKSKSGLR